MEVGQPAMHSALRLRFPSGELHVCNAHHRRAHPHVNRPAKEGLRESMPADGHTLPHKGGISARPADSTDETLHQFSLLKKRREYAANGPRRHLLQCTICSAIEGTATRKRQGEPERGALRSSGLSPKGQKAEDFHRYNYRMDVAADLDREASYAFGNRVSLTTGNTSTTSAANYFSIPPLTSNPGVAATTTYSYDNNGNLAQWLDYAPYGSVIASENTATTTAARSSKIS
jgi:hypothetical protein